MSRSWFGILIAKFRSSRPDVFCEKSVLRNFAKFTGKHLCQSLFLIKLQPWGLQLYLIRDSGTGVFLWILQNFSEQLFRRTPPDDCFCELSFELTLFLFLVICIMLISDCCLEFYQAAIILIFVALSYLLCFGKDQSKVELFYDETSTVLRRIRNKCFCLRDG